MAEQESSSKRTVEDRALLVRALRRDRFKGICKSEPRDYTVAGTRLSVLLLSAILASLTFFIIFVFGWSVWTAIPSVFVSLLAGVVAIWARAASPLQIYLLYVVLWVAGAVYLLLCGTWQQVLVVYIVPALVALAIHGSFFAFRLAATIPLFVPVALLLVLAPLLTEDPWKFAATAGDRIAYLALLALTPLVLILFTRLVRISVRDIFRDAIQYVIDNQDSGREAAEAALRNVASNEVASSDLAALKKRFCSAIAEIETNAALEQLASSSSKEFKRDLLRRLSMLILGIFSATYALMYVLACTAMPIELAADWSDQEITTHDFNVLGMMLTVPLGSYLYVSGLFAVLATAGFLAFASTDENNSQEVVMSLIVKPARRLATLALPYIALSDRSS